ncbi:MAG TPA: hypothetical protein DDZ04_02065 [Parabacteroides sp.]|nr:hypothetical protein [Parabacteroides sp.]
MRFVTKSMISYIVRYIVDKKAGRWMKKNRNTFDDNEKGCTFAIERWLQKKERLIAANLFLCALPAEGILDVYNRLVDGIK